MSQIEEIFYGQFFMLTIDFFETLKRISQIERFSKKFSFTPGAKKPATIIPTKVHKIKNKIYLAIQTLQHKASKND